MGVQFAEMDVAKYAKVKYDFDSEDVVELTIRKYDVVKIHKFDGEWCYGELNGNQGWFPYNHVEDINEEEYNRLLKEKLNGNNLNSSKSTIDEKKNGEENNEKNEEENNEKNEEIHEDDDKKNKLKALERQIKCSTIGRGTNRASTDGTRSWYSAYQGSIRYKSKNASIIAMKENSPNVEKNSSEKVNSRQSSIVVDLSRKESVKAKSDSNLLSNISESHLFRRLDNRKSESRKSDAIEFINGPAKLKMKWVDFIGGQSVVDSMGLTKKSIKRQEVIFEMIDTERDYVNDLSIIINLYMQPMIKNNLLPKKEINILFSNVELIYGVNQELLNRFEKRQKENPYIEEIGDIWLSMHEYLKGYLFYCGNYAYAITHLEALKNSKSVTKFLNTQFHKKESRSLRLESFLIKPVQRICKYPLLLREIIKCTDESHKDYENIIKAYEKLEVVVTVVNGASKEAEAVYNLIALQSRFTPKISIVSDSRRLKYKYEVNVYMKKLSSPTQNVSSILNSIHNIEKKKRLLFIFDDLILFAKSLSQEPDRLEKGKLKLIQKREYSCVEVKQNSNPDDPNMKNAIEIMLYSPDIFTIIFCEKEEIKNIIVNHLNSYINEYQNINKHESRPKIIKNLPSEKVYSMISNKNQETNEDEDDGEITATQEKYEEKKEKSITELNSNTENDENKLQGYNKVIEELENSTPITNDEENDYSDSDKLPPLRNSDMSSTLANSNVVSCSSLDSFTDGNIIHDESIEGDINDEVQKHAFNEVKLLLNTFISNSNERLEYIDSGNDTNEYSHEKESSVIIKEDEDNSPILYKGDSRSHFSPSLGRFGLRSSTIDSKNPRYSVILNEHPEIVENKEHENQNNIDKTKHESGVQLEKRRSILNRISFYEKISTSTKDDNDDGSGFGNCQVNLSNNYPIKNAFVNDVLCKMKNAKKYYVYEINVNLNSCASNVIPALKNNTKSSIIIYHTFEEFFDFHFQFIEATFSNKENKNNISINQIPTLPYQIQCVNDRIARKRISGLQTYINGILNLSTSIVLPDIFYNFMSASGFDSEKLMED
ncbi:hypothetical protein H8356DRAFT_1738822 [Neocallimastix lanati (nom. inval.)]|nr:hypothetical protein H8356DRAFT_1738822 [Neocallimastix sp. JGI-2020a]